MMARDGLQRDTGDLEPEDAFLQPEKSNSSPIRRRTNKSHALHRSTATAGWGGEAVFADLPPRQPAVPVVAASADLADLMRDFNALSARCHSSEKQLAAAKRALMKERARNQQLRASLSTLHNGQPQGQDSHSHTQLPGRATAGLAGQQAAAHPQPPFDDGGSTPDQQAQQNATRGAGGAAAAATGQQQAAAPGVMAGVQSHPRCRWSTDTAVADQGSRSSSGGGNGIPVHRAPSTGGSTATTPSPEPAAAAAATDKVTVLPAGAQTLSDLVAASELTTEVGAIVGSCSIVAMSAVPQDVMLPYLATRTEVDIPT